MDSSKKKDLKNNKMMEIKQPFQQKELTLIFQTIIATKKKEMVKMVMMYPKQRLITRLMNAY
jgi:hypothetical protein